MRYIFCFIICLTFSFSLIAQEVLQQEMGTYSSFGNFILNNQELYFSKVVTAEESSDITIMGNAPQAEFGGGEADAYFEKRNLEGELLWNTFLGGEGEDGGQIIGFHGDDVYVWGSTTSFNNIATSDVFQENLLEYEINSGVPPANNYLAKLNQAEGEKVWGTYFRSTDSDIMEHITDAAVAPDGSVYIVGRTQSEENIATSEAFDGVLGESYLKGFIQKFDVDGNREWGTYYGSSNSRDLDLTYINKIVVDHNGDVIISGVFVGLNPGNYFITPDTYNDGQNLAYDVFLAKFDNEGNRIWGLMYGGADIEASIDLKVDSQNNILFFGSTKSLEDIATPGAHQENFGSSDPVNDTDDAFLAKFDSEGQLLWGTYYGGHKEDSYGSSSNGLGFGGVGGGNRSAIAIDEENNIFITAQTQSIDKIATPDVYQDSLNNENRFDAYIAKLNNSGERLWGTYFGGNENEKNTGILYAGDDLFFIFGTTESTNAIATDNAWWENELSDEESNFLSKFSIQTLDVPTHEKNDFMLYPNPSSGIFKLSGSFTSIEVSVYNVKGQHVASFSDVKPNQNMELNVAHGVYFIKIKGETGTKTLKLLVNQNSSRE